MNTHMGRHIFWIVFGGMICLFSSCNNYSVSEKQAESFLKYYAAGIDENTGTEVIQTSDGYAILGNFEGVSGQKDIFVVFTDEFGRQKTSNPIVIGTNLNNHGHSMIRLDNGYLISGSSSDAGSDSIHGYLVNISSDGGILWERNYGGYQELVFRNAARATDGHLIITGYSISDAGDDMEAIIFKTSATGDSMWLRPYTYSGRNDVGEAIIEYQNRYHVLTTSTDVRDIRLSRIRMLNTNTDGRAQTNYEIQKDYYSGKDIAVNTAGNMYILGNNEDPGTRVSSIFLAELELILGGQITTLKDSASIPYQESLHAESFAPAEQNGLAIGGWQIKTNDNDILFLLVDVDNDFQPSMIKTYGSKGYQTSHNIIYTSDQGFALTGSVDLAGGRTSMLLKIDSEGELR